MSPDALQELVKQCLEAFYTRRINNLSGLRLKDVLKRKNPCLLRAIGIRTASELVEYLLQMHTQASDETIFGETFVEPKEWAKAVNRFTRDLLNEFADPSGALDWEKILRFNAG